MAAPSGQIDTPALLLDLDFGEQIDGQHIRLFDLGDVNYRPTEDNAHRLGARAAHLCRNILNAGARPVLLGGDHALAYYSIGALAERYPNLGVVQFDAHPDLYLVANRSEGQINHANVMRHVCRMSHVKSIWQVGVRDAFLQPTEGLRAEPEPRLKTLSAYEAETSGYERLFANMDRNLPWFISFDVDVLAGSELPHTATPVLGGLSFYKLLGCFERLFSEFNIVGLEFVEIGDATPNAHGTAAISARLITRFLFHLRGKTPCQTIWYAPS